MTANPISAMLDTIKEHGWTCQHPAARHPIQDDDKKLHRCVYVTGSLQGIPDAAVYLSDSSLVLLTGQLRASHSKDVDFAEFCKWLKAGKLPEPEGKKVLPGQRNLFGDEE